MRNMRIIYIDNDSQMVYFASDHSNGVDAKIEVPEEMWKRIQQITNDWKNLQQDLKTMYKAELPHG